MEPEIISVTPESTDPVEPLDEGADAESEQHTLAVSVADHGCRIDKFLATSLPALSRSYFQQLLAQGDVTCNGRQVAKASTAVKAGQAVVVQLRPTEQARSFLPEEMPLAVVHEDSHLMVLNKPAGLVVHPGAGNWSGTLLNGLLHHCPDSVNLPRAGIVHRLDKDTSGLMVVAKTREVMDSLVRLIADRSVVRLYVALAEGSWRRADKLEVREPMGRDPANRLRMAVLAEGKAGAKPARTTFKLLGTSDGLSLVACKLDTGRTHQIRVHLTSLGHPIVADSLYGGHAGHGLVRQALHATRLSFVHPVFGEAMSFQVPPPPDMIRAMVSAGLTYNTALIDADVFS